MSLVTPQKRSHADFSEEPVVVTVGREKRSFKIHPSQLIKHSTYFRAMFSNSQWLESKTGRASLPDYDTKVDTFQRYCSWIYTGKIDLPDYSHVDEEEETGALRHPLLVDLYILADQIGDMGLRNAVMDRMIALEHETGYSVGANCVDVAYDKVAETSTLCRFLVASRLAQTSPKWIEDSYDFLPFAFIQALLVGWAKSSGDHGVQHKYPGVMPKCAFHEHDTETPVRDACARSFDQDITPAPRAILPLLPPPPLSTKKVTTKRSRIHYA